MEAKLLSLGDLALLDVDVDQLLNKAEKKRSLSDELRKSLVVRGRMAYAESLSSIDSDSHSFSSHTTSKSTRSNASSSISSVQSSSSRVSGSKKTKVFSRMSLSAVEAVALAETRIKSAAEKKVSRERNYELEKSLALKSAKRRENTLRNNFFNSIEEDGDSPKDASKEISDVASIPHRKKDNRESTYPQLNSNDILKLVEILGPSLKKTSNIRTLMDSYTLSTQHFVMRNIRRVKHLIEKHSLLGIRKSKKNKKIDGDSEQICVKLADWINKHVFFPRSVHLQVGGSKLFLVMFKLVVSNNLVELKKMRRVGWRRTREKTLSDESKISKEILPLLDGLQSKDEKEKLYREIGKVVGEKKKYRKERLKAKADKQHRKNKKQNKHSPTNNQTARGTKQQSKAKRGGLKGAQLEEYIDESGIKRSIRWSKFIDADGAVLYANELTGEVLPEDELHNHFLKTSMDGERLREKKRLVEGSYMLSGFFDSDDEIEDASEKNSTGVSSTAAYFDVKSIKRLAKRVILGKFTTREENGRRGKSWVQTEDGVV
eukprot:g8041.t1